ncbi:MAG: hypothetical protein CL943_02510 [Candidatus Diapherotrites archaeon]|uniref:Uncharacterized protein n=1 Tax=Candidatus Iainarchaeum sp. TaxID=3101447 RepID=A0A2D6M153_9ARCH|nr:hypothetical protein [Candidatus Diapherotrites archaeon]
MESKDSIKTSVSPMQKKGRFMYVDGKLFWVPNSFELVYKKVNINGKNIPFPFGFKRKSPEKCELN